MDDSTDIDDLADELVQKALDGDPEALRELKESGALDELDETDEEIEVTEEKPDPLHVHLEKNETEGRALARAMLRPTLQGAATLGHYNKWFPAKGRELNELIQALTEQTNLVIDGKLDRGEAMLAVQAHTLDAIFNSLARMAQNADLLTQFDTYLKFALRAQSQCRTTWEAISEIQNPPLAGYVKQANIAQNQQVNNDGGATRARETQNGQSKLLEHTEHEPDKWMDRGTPAAAERADSTVEAVGEVNGTENRRRQGQGCKE
jgi:hypothetical protein